MFCMGQDQNKGVELEDKVVESQPYGVTRTMKVPPICIIIDSTVKNSRCIDAALFVNCFATTSSLFKAYLLVLRSILDINFMK